MFKTTKLTRKQVQDRYNGLSLIRNAQVQGTKEREGKTLPNYTGYRLMRQLKELEDEYQTYQEDLRVAHEEANKKEKELLEKSKEDKNVELKPYTEFLSESVEKINKEEVEVKILSKPFNVEKGDFGDLEFHSDIYIFLDDMVE